MVRFGRRLTPLLKYDNFKMWSIQDDVFNCHKIHCNRNCLCSPTHYLVKQNTETYRNYINLSQMKH